MHRIHFSLSDTGTTGDTGLLPSGKLEHIRVSGDTGGTVTINVLPNKSGTAGSYGMWSTVVDETQTQLFWPRGRDTGSAQDTPYVFVSGERMQVVYGARGASTASANINVWVYIEDDD